MKSIIAFPIVLISFIINAQVTGPEQDCENAIHVSQSGYIQANSYSGPGAVDDINGNSRCLQNDENNSVWYTFSILAGGLLEFTIDPVNSGPNGDDYDFSLFNLTNGNCSDIAIDRAREVRCNYAFTNGATGLQSGYSSTFAGPGDSAFLAPLQVTTGELFALVIDNFSSSQGGYALTFGGTAIMGAPGDTILRAFPHIANGSPCGGGLITLDARLIGGSGHYIINWSGTVAVDSPNNQITTVTIPDTGSYFFTVLIIDSVINDTIVESISINASSVPYEVDAGSTTGIGCHGGTFALLEASVITANGAGSIFQWSNGFRGKSVIVVPGTYSVTATDAGGCLQSVDHVTVFGNMALSFSTTHENCGAGDGAISAVVNGGLGSVSYNWSGGHITGTISGLSAGTYILTVTDSISCVRTDSVTILDSCGVITGKVFHDLNSDGLYDMHEPGIPGVEVFASGGLRSLSDSRGNYQIIVPTPGNYGVTINKPYRYYCMGYYWLPDILTYPVSGNHMVSISGGNTVFANQDFGLSLQNSACGEVRGFVFRDTNANGLFDSATETGYSGALIKLDPIGIVNTNQSGNYNADVPFTTITISALTEVPYYCNNINSMWQTYPANPLDYTVTLTPVSPLSTGNDFGFSPGNMIYDVGVFNIWPGVILAGQNVRTFMDWKRQGNVTTDCYLYFAFDSAYLSFVGSMPPPDTVGINFVGWFFPAGDARQLGCYAIDFYVKPNATFLTPISFTGYWSCTNQDNCTYNDSLTRLALQISPRLDWERSLTTMYVYHQNDEEKYEIDREDSTFSYLISFNNKTEDTIYCMTIVDTLPPHFQLNSISYPFSNKLFNFQVLNNNILIWEFPEANIPPERDNLLASYGFVQFNINMEPDLPGGTIFENRAAVIFNFSDPVFTNKVENILAGPDSVIGVYDNVPFDNYFSLFPNPNSGEFRILAHAEETTDWEISMYNMTGKLIFSRMIGHRNEIKESIDVVDMPKGIYLLRLENSTQAFIRKIVIQ